MTVEELLRQKRDDEGANVSRKGAKTQRERKKAERLFREDEGRVK